MGTLPDLESLRCFVEAARTLNFRAAARTVGITPAALGQRIRKLEQQLDTTIFDRNTRHVVLTQSGLNLLPRAEAALAAGTALVDAARGDVPPLPRQIEIGTRHELGLSWLLPMLPHLREAFPGTTFHLYFGSGEDLENRVHTGDIDCAVSSRSIGSPSVDSCELHEETYAFVGAPALLAHTPFEGAEDAADHVLLDTHASFPLFRYWRDAPNAPTDVRFGGLLRMGTIAALRELVLAGEGVAVLPRYLIRDDLECGALVELLPRVRPLSDHFRLLFHADDERSALFQSLANRMREHPLR